MAFQASGAVLVRYGETAVLVTAVMSERPREGVDFLPLTCDYLEMAYAAGRIPGGFFRREIGRPSEKETLTSRLIDRPLRPLFPKGTKREIQIIATVLSSDLDTDSDIPALNGAAAALEISDIPFQGPVAAVRVGKIGDQLDHQSHQHPTQGKPPESDRGRRPPGSGDGGGWGPDGFRKTKSWRPCFSPRSSFSRSLILSVRCARRSAGPSRTRRHPRTMATCPNGWPPWPRSVSWLP
jgi:hypothetical protein